MQKSVSSISGDEVDAGVDTSRFVGGAGGPEAPAAGPDRPVGGPEAPAVGGPEAPAEAPAVGVDT